MPLATGTTDMLPYRRRRHHLPVHRALHGTSTSGSKRASARQPRRHVPLRASSREEPAERSSSTSTSTRYIGRRSVVMEQRLRKVGADFRTSNLGLRSLYLLITDSQPVLTFPACVYRDAWNPVTGTRSTRNTQSRQ